MKNFSFLLIVLIFLVSCGGFKEAGKVLRNEKVNSTDEFTDQPKVINGASDTIAKIFGDSGIHTRAAVSTNSLPLGVAIEVDAIFELK